MKNYNEIDKIGKMVQRHCEAPPPLIPPQRGNITRKGKNPPFKGVGGCSGLLRLFVPRNDGEEKRNDVPRRDAACHVPTKKSCKSHKSNKSQFRQNKNLKS